MLGNQGKGRFSLPEPLDRQTGIQPKAIPLRDHDPQIFLPSAAADIQAAYHVPRQPAPAVKAVIKPLSLNPYLSRLLISKENRILSNQRKRPLAVTLCGKGAHYSYQIKGCPLMVSWKRRPRRSAALRHRDIRFMKISKYSITELTLVSTVNSSVTVFCSRSIFSSEWVTE